MDSYGVMQPAKLIKNRQVWTYLPSELSLRTEHTVSKQSIQEHNTTLRHKDTDLSRTWLHLTRALSPSAAFNKFSSYDPVFSRDNKLRSPFFFFLHWLETSNPQITQSWITGKKVEGGPRLKQNTLGGGRFRQTDSWMDSLIRSTKIDREAHEKMKRRGLGERKGERARRAGLREKSVNKCGDAFASTCLGSKLILTPD